MNKQPNIILLMMDSVRAANLSCYGYHRATTPNIDALATQGTLFEQAISVGCWTLPVHVSLFTGLYPLNHGVTISKDALPPNFLTLARQLKELGYQTACFSNNAYISEANGLAQGFDTVEDVWRISHPRGTRRTKMWKLIKHLEQYGRLAKPAIRLARALQQARSILKGLRSRRDSGAQLTNEKIQTWLTEFRNPDASFFMFVNYMDCHEPYNPPYPYKQRFMPTRFSPWRVAGVGTNKEVALRILEKRGQDDLKIIQALYDGEISYLDDKIGELVQFIESLGILDETVLVLTSDHGDCLGEHNQIGHRMALYEQLVHVPLIIRYPERFQPAVRVMQQVSLVDLYPTLLELAGADPSQANKNGFHSLITPPAAEARPFIIAENTAPKSLNSVIARMIRTDRYKYIWKSNQQHELYDLVKDPGELANLVAVEPETARKMDEQLKAWKRSLGDHRIGTNQTEYDEEIVERLRALGYVE
jgi:arylsulfatase A-like enzyme